VHDHWLTLGTLASLALLVACEEASQPAARTPFTGEQIDRIVAGLRERRLQEGVDLPAEDREEEKPIWVAQELLDEDMRLVAHVRLAGPGDLANRVVQERRCARTREQIVDYLLPGQVLEMYLVFDTSVHACGRDDRP
jgi:hypothetical protein